jgi:hypothetical protein
MNHSGFRNVIVAFWVFTTFLFISPLPVAADVWGSEGFTTFSESLPKASPESLKKITKAYWPFVQTRSGLVADRLKLVSFDRIDPVLKRAADDGMGILDLFTMAELANPSAPGLVLDAQTLRSIDEKYDLWSVWQLSTKPLIKDKPLLTMDYMIVGQGKLIIGYPFAAPVEVLDEGKAFEVTYEPLIRADIINTPGSRGLHAIATLHNDAKELQPFRGPMSTSIKSYEVQGDRIVVTYNAIIDQQSLARRKPISLKNKSVASN